MSNPKERDWIENKGDKPVGATVLVDVKWNDGSIDYNKPADEWQWSLHESRKMRLTHWCLAGKEVETSNDPEQPQRREEDTLQSKGSESTNPKKQYGVQSIPLNLWSPLASAYGALGLYNGGLKYGFGNYKGTPVEASIYIAAAMRHLSAWAEGEEYDSKDGVPNLGGVLANIAILLDARAANTLIDDRIISGGYVKEREELSKIVVSLNKLHEGKTPKHYYQSYQKEQQ